MTITEFINYRIYAKHRRLEWEVRKLGIEYATIAVLRPQDVSPDHHVVVADSQLRDLARDVIRAAERDLICHAGDDGVLVIASAV